MAKKFTDPNRPATYPVPSQEGPAMFSPAWLELHKADLEKAGLEYISKEELQAKKDEADTLKQATKDLIGIDLDAAEVSAEQSEHRLRPILDIIKDMRNYLEMAFQSSQWRSLVSQKEQNGLFYVRVFIRQLLNEKAPPGQASCLRELIPSQSQLPDGPMNDRGTRARRDPERKPFKLTHHHLEALKK